MNCFILTMKINITQTLHSTTITLLRNHQTIGKSIVSCFHGIGSINNIWIEKKHQNNNYGSHLLRRSEQYLHTNYPNLTQINILAWVRPYKPLLQFYTKHGYCIDPQQWIDRHTIHYFDDGLDMFELVLLRKQLVRD